MINIILLNLEIFEEISFLHNFWIHKLHEHKIKKLNVVNICNKTYRNNHHFAKISYANKKIWHLYKNSQKFLDLW